MGNEPKPQDSLKTAVSGLSEQTKKLEIASYYTHGDFEKAKQMVAGTYRDIYAIKGKFSSSSMYGAFIIFFNNVWSSLAHIHAIVTHSFDINDIKTNIDWRIFEKEISDNLTRKEHDDVLTSHVKEELANGFTMQFGNELKRLLDSGDEITINHLFQKLAQTRMGFQNVKCTLDIEQLSSLDMELLSISSRKINLEEYRRKLKEEETKKEVSPEEEGMDNSTITQKDVRLLLNGSLILAPIKGKEIGQLVTGDRVKIKIVDSNPKAMEVLRAFNAIQDNNVLPITGRIVSIKRRADGTYVIFVIIAKGIFVQIEEEEDNIKVAMDPGSLAVESAGSDAPSGLSLPVIIILILVFFGLVGLVLGFVFF